LFLHGESPVKMQSPMYANFRNNLEVLCCFVTSEFTGGSSFA
jgi:hypothetical protein